MNLQQNPFEQIPHHPAEVIAEKIAHLLTEICTLEKQLADGNTALDGKELSPQLQHVQLQVIANVQYDLATKRQELDTLSEELATLTHGENLDTSPQTMPDVSLDAFRHHCSTLTKEELRSAEETLQATIRHLGLKIKDDEPMQLLDSSFGGEGEKMHLLAEAESQLTIIRHFLAQEAKYKLH